MSSTGIMALAASALAIGIAAVGASAYTDAQRVADELTLLDRQTIQKAYGISDLVWDCAADVLSDKTVDDLVVFIESEVPTAGTPEETSLVTQIKECIYKDPFGWHGTENEWAIELLEIEKWEK